MSGGRSKAQATLEYTKQAKRLGHEASKHLDHDKQLPPRAVEAHFVTTQDPVIKTADGERLPTVPVQEALKLNALSDEIEGKTPRTQPPVNGQVREAKDGTIHGIAPCQSHSKRDAAQTLDNEVTNEMPKASTDPLFPPVPIYGGPSFIRNLQCYMYRISSWFLSLAFLGVILLGALFTAIPMLCNRLAFRLKGQRAGTRRPFYEEEERREKKRKEAEQEWMRRKRRQDKTRAESDLEFDAEEQEQFVPLEGGPDPLVCDASYYARRVGLDIEEFKVQTEDGFIIDLWHVYNPKEYVPASSERRRQHSAEIFRRGNHTEGLGERDPAMDSNNRRKKYPVLLMHGLLQSGGAYCCTDDDSLAFMLAKSGYDVWIGNNRCGFHPTHSKLNYSDPRMWSWNIRQYAVFDLPALISRVLGETGFEKLGLVCHSQGTTLTFVALAKEQRPEIGEKISVFCALAPAAYAGPLVKKVYFKFMRIISPRMFRVMFGIHSFIPFMNQMHAILPGRFYGMMGYRVFSFLFDWSDKRWDRGLRNRAFQFSPTYVSAESMRWWLGRECFATQKCILSTRLEGQLEDEEDMEEDCKECSDGGSAACSSPGHDHENRGKYAWYDERAPTMAFWVAGQDELVDGARLLRRFDRGREPHVDVIYMKVIDDYEHLDVLWSIDAFEQVGSEVRSILWQTAPKSAREVCRIPTGCEGVPLHVRRVGKATAESAGAGESASLAGNDYVFEQG